PGGRRSPPFGGCGMPICSNHLSALVGVSRFQQPAREQYQQLARPALRRVIALNRSVGTLSEYLAVRYQRLDSLRKEVVEGRELAATDLDVAAGWLEGLGAQIQLHVLQVEDAISDWRELMPGEYQKYQDIGKIQADIRAETMDLIESSARKSGKEVADQTARIRKLEAALAAKNAMAGIITVGQPQSFRISDGSVNDGVTVVAAGSIAPSTDPGASGIIFVEAGPVPNPKPTVARPASADHDQREPEASAGPSGG
ncbi:MAG: hypothetical protein ACYC6T_17930, partial [Thermoleophilia bacterium]